MNSNILKKMKSLATLFLAIFTLSAFAQDINQAGEMLNEGNQAVKSGNFVEAIQKYNESIKIASALGAEGEQIVSGAKAQIPSLYYKIGATDYKAKKIDKAISEFNNAIKYGEEYGDTETVKKSEKIIPKLYYSKGNSLYKEKKYDEALAAYMQSNQLNPEYSRAIWGMGLVYSKQKKYDEMDNAFTNALKIAEAEGDSKMAAKIQSKGKKVFQSEGAGKLQAQAWNDALKYLNASLKYDDSDRDTYYYLALAYNGQKSYDDALKATQKGLELSQAENQEYKAKFYYEMGNAYKGKGMNDKACAAYTDANHGRFVESASYELKTVLKCN
jgi:tetratricopeptide (TPR) repeat protein